MNEISTILIRLRELSVQAASDTVGPTERQFLNVEYDQLVSEIDRISEGTEFNGTQLLAGVGSILDFQVGTRNNPEIDRISFDASKADANSAALGVNLTSVSDKASAQNALAAIDQDDRQRFSDESRLRCHSKSSTINGFEYPGIDGKYVSCKLSYQRCGHS